MPRQYKRKIGSRTYLNYTEDRLAEALNEIKNKQISLRGAAEKYGIHRNTLWLKIKGKHNKKAGQQKVFTDEEENVFAAHIITVSAFGFPVTTFDLRRTVKSYLERQGKVIKCFKNNLPGSDWVKTFLMRHPQLSQRMAQNITHSRAAIDEQVINNFFDNLEVELQGIPASNIWNYDETNLVDDPGQSKIITKRGTKYPERIRNSSKACTSLMVCGNAEGRLAPLYVNYKSQKLWTTWTENGPPNARYNRTASGWFDYQIFEDWFLHILLPLLKRQEGRKAIIGDNLSSHLNQQVIQECEANDIRFIALPPNTTHLLQPLDVAFFRPMKEKWRKILNEWKASGHGSRYSSIPKDEFPSLLKKLMNQLEDRAADNLKSGFRKTGISPLDRQHVLGRLCDRIVTADSQVTEVVGKSFIEHLTKVRTETTKGRQIRRRKRLDVPPGKSISSSDFNNGATAESTNNTDEPQPGTSGISAHRKKLQRNKHQAESGSTSEEEDELEYQESDDSPWDEHLSNDEDEHSPQKEVLVAKQVEKLVGQYVVVQFEGNYFPGQITKVLKSGATINVMASAGKQWKWPDKKDEIFYKNDEIIMSIKPPTQRGKRALFDIPELNDMLD